MRLDVFDYVVIAHAIATTILLGVFVTTTVWLSFPLALFLMPIFLFNVSLAQELRETAETTERTIAEFLRST